MTRIEIFTSDRFALVSYGGGISYALHNHPAKKSLFVQGDDATTLRDEIDAWKRIDPDMPTESILAEIWDGYVDLATAN
jgi:hypothetical protein